MNRKEMEEALTKLPPLPTPPKTRRVSNDIGALTSGGQGHRIIMLISLPAWKALVDADDIFVTGPKRALHLLFGIAHASVHGSRYEVNTVSVIEGYAGMLRALTSGVAYSDGLTEVSYQGQMIYPKRWGPWGPYAGLRRRGLRAVQQVQRAHKLKDDSMDQLVGSVREAFLVRVIAGHEPV